MINSITGIITYKSLDILRVENSFIEWEFLVPSRAIDLFGKLGDETRVICWLLHRDDQMRLFGFPDEVERSFFLELMTVDGIGPRQALKILSGIAPNDLESALEAEDSARLESVPGLGKKTAQKMLFALKGKLPSAVAAGGKAEEPRIHDDIVKALQDLGYDRKRAGEAVAKIAKGMDEKELRENEQEIFRKAIIALSGS